MALQFDNKISLGNLVVIAVTVCGLAAGYATMQADLRQHKVRMDRLEAASAEREGRLRAVELMQASQASDLRNIRDGIVRIETALERMARRD